MTNQSNLRFFDVRRRNYEKNRKRNRLLIRWWHGDGWKTMETSHQQPTVKRIISGHTEMEDPSVKYFVSVTNSQVQLIFSWYPSGWMKSSSSAPSPLTISN